MVAHITLTIALSHLITFLTGPLVNAVAPQTIERLRASLEANLVKEYENIWYPAEPQRGTQARCLSLSPNRLPPRPLLAAAFAARLPWSQWISVLGGQEFDIFVDPGSVSVRLAGSKTHVVVWTASSSVHVAGALDKEFDEEFVQISREMSKTPSWLSPILGQFPKVPQPPVKSSISPSLRLDTVFLQSRCASRLSNVSDADSESSITGPPSLVESDSLSSVSSLDTGSSRSRSVYVPPARRGLSSRFSSPSASSDENDDVYRPASLERKERARVDTSKTQVTVYAGKTTVLAGGVMLGMGAPAKKRSLYC
ncbi:hypothetical protein EXIGLDRAFT_511146 [Exidia glandulosa HHB12029]|uniref:Anti-proliferative protein domain-containing protein n=1 Tax=Exidia glandulosa HHB12029 TaxID=1314781 RepID=A0A165PE09_EXIGL|nr:hypothetical protein EXIGLDRAFT_511146 [Exidia glandulosa HHB12029]